jgi:plastocyanin
MTWLLPICFSLLLSQAWGATVSGRIRLTDSPLPAVSKKHNYSGVVVWLEPTVPSTDPPPHAARARIIQKNKQFLPHVLAIQVGTSVEFPNRDPIFHSAFSTFSGQIFDLGLYAPGTSRTVPFRHAGIVRIFCNIHPTMSAIIAVLKDPWFAISNSEGAFTIPNVPAGEYVLKLFDERAHQKTLDSLARRISVGAGEVAVPAIAVSETGYVETPHKNKYGQDYASVPGDQVGYPTEK